VTDVIASPAAPEAIGPYSQGVRVGAWLFTSGQIPIDPRTGALVGGGIAEQTAQVLDNLQAILVAAGGSLAQVVKTTVYLASLDDFTAMNDVYATYFVPPLPARSTVQVARLPKDARVEVDCVAWLGAPDVAQR